MNRQLLAILGCVVLVGLAGCSAIDSQFGTNTSDIDFSTFSGNITEQKTDRSAAKNPWAVENITVSVADSTKSDRDWEPLVKDALDYWNGNMSRLNHTGRFVYSDSGDTDLKIRIVDDIRQCGTEQVSEDTHGCAPIYTEVGAGAVNNQPVIVENELQDRATIDVTIHEIGHTLGLQHSDADTWPIMNETVAAPSLPKPNATEIANPWPNKTVRLYYNNSNGELNDTEINALETARAYYDDGADGFLPDTTSVVRTNDSAAADIEIQMVDSVGGEVRSRWSWRGFDPDADGALETYETATIKIETSVSGDTLEWQVGYALGNLFGVTDDSELPPPFDNSRTFDSDNW